MLYSDLVVLHENKAPFFNYFIDQSVKALFQLRASFMFEKNNLAEEFGSGRCLVYVRGSGKDV